jgi:hypothetical protein
MLGGFVFPEMKKKDKYLTLQLHHAKLSSLGFVSCDLFKRGEYH